MYNPDQTSLRDLPSGMISAELMQQLKSCWIESVEEMLAATGVLRNANIKPVPPILSQLESVVTTLGVMLPRDAVTVWIEPQQKAVYPLGNASSSEYALMFQRYGSIRHANQIESISPPPLTSSCDLTSRLLSVRNQGERGLCVACTIASLMEYLTHSAEPMSIDFIYDCCKKLDGFAGIEGTDLKTAMSAVGQFGICFESVFHAFRNHAVNEEDLLTEARKNRIENIRQILPGVIEDYKMKLSGVENSVPMPIAVSLLVFDSTVQSPASALSGKWTLPLPGEPLSGRSHAMLIVGYQDDPSVPGGGYFLARNSWGEDWAAMSPINHPGHAMIPYEYVQRFCIDAFTGPKIPIQDTSSNLPITNDDFGRRYVFALSQDGREYTGTADKIGRLVKAGTKVIAMPDRPDQFKVDTAANRKVFIGNDYSWDSEQRARNLFPESLSDTWESRLRFIDTAGRLFANAIEANLRSLTDTAFPLPDKKGWFSSGITKIKAVAECADLSAILAHEMTLGVPDDLAVSSCWQEITGKCNSLKIMRITTGKRTCFVAIVWVHPIRFESRSEPRLEIPTMETVAKIRALLLQWIHDHDEVSEMNFITVATSGKWDNTVRSSLDIPTVFSAFNENETWHTILPVTTETKETRSPMMQDFIGKLSPETLSDKMTKVRNAISRKIAEHFEGNILVRFIAREVNLSERETEDIFRKLTETGMYEIYKAKDSLAIKKRR